MQDVLDIVVVGGYPVTLFESPTCCLTGAYATTPNKYRIRSIKNKVLDAEGLAVVVDLPAATCGMR